MMIENLTNTHIKGYELRERLGTGGFGAVYKAFQSTVGREVAIKIILAGFANRPEFIRRFETEAQLIARLEHPYITPLYDYWRDPDGAYLVMRWLRGGSLRDALENGAYELEAAAQVMEQISSALSVAHRNNVIHRDLKPGNILLDEDGNAYLADFGIAKDLGVQVDATAPDVVVGSLDYLSPEQARSEPVTPRTDIYSLGVVLYELLTGKHPYADCTAVEKLYKHLNEPLPDLTTFDPAVQANLNAVVQKATAKNPAHRYADALEFIAAFRQAAALHQTTGSVVELLTLREQEVLERIIAGLSNKEIAQELFITVPTVKWYVTQVFQKLHVRSRVQAIVRARELNLVVGDGISLAAESASSISRLPDPENPYKGLRAFQTADARDFFGREALVQKLVGRLDLTPQSSAQREEKNAGRFLAVVGPSGSGKSSLVKAGIIPALLRGDIPGSERWFVVEMLPGERPLDELEVALIKIAANQAPNLGEQLRRDRNGLLRAASLILPHDGSELVLVIDQFEEVFTLVEDEAARTHFLDLIHAATTDHRSRVRIVVTLRADFYDRPLYYPDFGELVRSHMETILPLTAEGLARAIAKPAEQIGLRFAEGLVTKIVGEVNYQPGALPLLQYALTELFERREGRMLTHEAYLAIGGTVGALAKRAEEIYEGLNEAGKESARQMFLRLVTLGEGTEDTRRRTARGELLAISTLTPNPSPSGRGEQNGSALDSASPALAGHEVDMDEIIDTYAAYRLLSLDNDPATRTPTIELAHEAIIREWERLRAWLNESRDDIKLQRQLSHAADDWKVGKRDTSFLITGSRLEIFEKWVSQTQLALTPLEHDFLSASLDERARQVAAEEARQAREQRLERRSQTFLRGLVAVLLLATLGAFGLTGVAINQSHIAQQNESEARSLALASSGQLALNEGNIDLAIQQAQAALQITDNALARRILDQAAFAPRTTRIFQETGSFLPSALALEESDLTFAMISHIGPEFGPFAQVLVRGMDDACALLNATCYWVSDPIGSPDPEQMIGHWDKALSLNPDGVGTTLHGADLSRSYIEQAAERGIPVMVFNVARESGDDRSLPVSLYIGSDEYIGGRSNAQRVFDEARADGVTIQRGACTIQVVDAPPLVARCAGVASVFDEEGVPLDQISISDESWETAASQIADYFAQNPNTNAIFMLGPGPAESLNLYIQQAGVQPGQLYATTHDTSALIFQMIRDGYLLQTIDQQPYMQGFQTIMSLYLYRQYGIRPSGYINTSIVVDQSNVDGVIQLVELGYR